MAILSKHGLGGLANYRDRQDNVLFYAEFQEYLDTFDDPNTAIDESLAVKNKILNTVENERLNNNNAKGGDC